MGRGRFRPLRCAEPPESLGIWARFCFVFFFLVVAATPPWLCRLPLPPPLGFAPGRVGFRLGVLVWAFCLLPAFHARRPPCGLCSHSRVQSASPGPARGSPTGKGFGIWIAVPARAARETGPYFPFYFIPCVFPRPRWGRNAPGDSLAALPLEKGLEKRLWDVPAGLPRLRGRGSVCPQQSLQPVGMGLRRVLPHSRALVPPFTGSVGCGVLG